MNFKKRWIYIPLGLIIFMAMGTIYSWSVFRKPIEQLYNISATQSGLPYMFFLVFYAIGMPIAGGFIDQYGPRRMTIIGGIFIGIGWILSSFASNIYFLIVSYGLIAGTGVGIAYGAPLAVASKWFPDKKGLAAGLTLAGFGLSPFITAPLANVLVQSYGPFVTFRTLGIAFTIIISLLALPLKFPEEKQIDQTKQSDLIVENDFSSQMMLKTKAFYGLWSVYTIGTLIGLMAIGISSPFAIEMIKLAPAQAAFYVSLFAIFNGIGRPFFGYLTDRFNPKNAALISFAMIIIAALLLLNTTQGNRLIYVVSFSILWLNLGGWLAIAPAATAQFFGEKNYSKNYGILFTAYGVGAVLGTLLSGSIRDVMGSYVFVFYPVIILAILGIFIAFKFVKKPTTQNSIRKKSSYIQ